ncbi:hypothetical protein ACNKHK_10230 [Shigella flexneri]
MLSVDQLFCRPALLRAAVLLFLPALQIRWYQRAGPAGDRGCCCAAGLSLGGIRGSGISTRRRALVPDSASLQVWRILLLRRGWAAGICPLCPSQRTVRRRTGAGLSVESSPVKSLATSRLYFAAYI